MSYSLRFLQLGARAILIEWPQIIDPLILKDVLFFKTIIKINYIKQKVELNSGYSSILILYDSTIDDVNGEVFKLEQLYKQQNKDSKPVF